MVVPLKHTYISLVCFISLCRFAFYGHFCRLIEVELKGFADYMLSTWYFTRPQFWAPVLRYFFSYKCCEEWVCSLWLFIVFLDARFSQWECPELSHCLKDVSSHMSCILWSQNHCASFLCVHNLQMEDKVFILKDCLSSCCWWFLIRPLSKFGVLSKVVYVQGFI